MNRITYRVNGCGQASVGGARVRLPPTWSAQSPQSIRNRNGKTAHLLTTPIPLGYWLAQISVRHVEAGKFTTH